jgi:hypothetical protein
MTRVLSAEDILSLISKEKKRIDRKIVEDSSIPMFAGSGDKKTGLIGAGFKIRHKDSGLTYTCHKLVDNGKKVVLIVKDDGIGDYHAIPGSDLDSYERM